MKTRAYFQNKITQLTVWKQQLLHITHTGWGYPGAIIKIRKVIKISELFNCYTPSLDYDYILTLPDVSYFFLRIHTLILSIQGHRIPPPYNKLNRKKSGT